MKKYKHFLSRIAAFAAAVLVLQSLLLPVCAEDGTEDIPLSMAQAYLIANLENGNIVKSTDTEAQLAPASTVKILSGLLLCEAYSGRLDEKITVTAGMAKDYADRSAGLRAGQSPTVKDLLYMGFCGCFNDAIRVLGIAQYGSEEGFVAALNRRGAELGMTSSYFVNATGVHSDTMHTTLSDLYRLCTAAYGNKLFMTVTSATAYSTEGLGNPFSFENYNKLISSGKYRNTLCRGLNAGSTPQSGYSLVTVAEKSGVFYLCIVLGAREADDTVYSYVIANRLITWALNRYGTKVLLSVSEVICEIPVMLSVKTESVIAVPAEEISAFIPLSYSREKEIAYEHTLDEPSLRAPVTVGQKVGTVTVYVDGKAMGTVDLVAGTAAEKSGLLETMEKIREFTRSDFFLGAVITFAVLILVWITVASIFSGSRKKSARKSNLR